MRNITGSSRPKLCDYCGRYGVYNWGPPEKPTVVTSCLHPKCVVQARAAYEFQGETEWDDSATPSQE
jgi:hypothetical protein